MSYLKELNRQLCWLHSSRAHVRFVHSARLVARRLAANPILSSNSYRLFKSMRCSFFKILFFIFAFLLMGCDEDANIKDIKKYIEETKANTTQKMESIPPVVAYQPYLYPEKQLRDPFKPFRTKNLAQSANKGKSAPDFRRPKQPLEAFPIDALRMVGTLVQDQKVWALISTPGGEVVRVSVGNYLGQNFGKIEDITHQEVKFIEIVPDGDDWKQRPSSLTLIDAEEKTNPVKE